MALKITAMSLTAVQVRAGYPSVQESMAAGSGQGRHSFYFYRHVNASHWIGFQVPSSCPRVGTTFFSPSLFTSRVTLCILLSMLY